MLSKIEFFKKKWENRESKKDVKIRSNIEPRAGPKQSNYPLVKLKYSSLLV